FTNSYLTYRSVIVVRNDTPFVPDIAALRERRFALVKGAAETERLLQRFPSLNAMYVDNVSDALDAVAAGKADATVGNIAVLYYNLREMNLGTLKVAAPADEEERRIYIAVRDDWPELVGSLNTGLAAVTP